eukprot:2096215-Lingulodinium_polyedra.AAC.1
MRQRPRGGRRGGHRLGAGRGRVDPSRFARVGYAAGGPSSMAEGWVARVALVFLVGDALPPGAGHHCRGQFGHCQ